MGRLFIGNFDFEHHLAGNPPQRSAGVVDRINRELAWTWVALAGADDAVWQPGRVDEEFWTELAAAGLPILRAADSERAVDSAAILCPWGWTESLCRWGRGQGWVCDAPPLRTLRTVNARVFSHALEHEWKAAPQGTAVVADREELTAALHRLPGENAKWVIKAEYGMSARERIVGSGRSLKPPAAHWTQTRLAKGEGLYFEPWLSRVAEVGIQFTVPKLGQPVLEGITPMFADASGVYRGSRFAAEAANESQWMAAVEIGTRVALRAQSVGYFGPLGIDAMRYRDEAGDLRVRAIQDVNARYTMGRLALGFRRLLRRGEVGSWLHVQWPTSDESAPRRHYDRIAASLPGGTRIVRTSPFEIDGRPVAHGTLIVIAESNEKLSLAEQQILGEDAASIGA